MPATIEQLLEQGAAQAEEAVRESRQLDYAWFQGAETFKAYVKQLAQRDPFDGNGHAAPAAGSQPANA